MDRSSFYDNKTKKEFYKVDDDTGLLKASSWIDFEIEKGDIVKIFGYLTQEKMITATHINIGLSYDEFMAHKLFFARNKIKMELQMYNKECFNINVEEWDA